MSVVARIVRHLLLLALLAGGGLAHAQKFAGFGSDDLLPPEKAFRFSADWSESGAIEIRYAIADGYYLYRDRFKFRIDEPAGASAGVAELPRGERKKDQFFGEVETYRKAVSIRLPVTLPAGAPQVLTLNVTSQGCADIGVCYTPQEASVTLRPVSLETPRATPGARGLVDAPRTVTGAPNDFDIAALFQGNLLLVLASFAGFGLLLAFTPCVLPMIPILSGIIAGEGAKLGRLRALILSLAYVLGMAIAYALAGIGAAWSGSLLAAALQSAWVLGGFALVFVGLALSMFGLYELRMPSFVHHRAHHVHQKLEGGRVVSVAAMGMLSAIIVSPCVAAPLAGALLYISRTGDVVLGGAALFAMALGMGVPLVVVGVSEGALLPKSGPWLLAVRKFFGALLLGVAIWIAAPVMPVALQMGLWAVLFVGGAIFLRALERLPAHAGNVARLGKAAGVLLLVAGVAMLAGALSGARDPLRPLAGLLGGTVQAELPWVAVNSPAELDARLREAGRPVMLDFYADWCVSCKEMEAFTFRDPAVRAKLERMLLLRADVTANTEAHRALLKRYALFGPPGIIFFDDTGRELRAVRVIGYQNAEQFGATLDRVLPGPLAAR